MIGKEIRFSVINSLCGGGLLGIWGAKTDLWADCLGFEVV